MKKAYIDRLEKFSDTLEWHNVLSEALRYGKLTRRSKVVDFGTGLGKAASFIRSTTGAQVIAVEPDDSLFHEATVRNPGPLYLNDTKIPDGQYDLIVCSHALGRMVSPAGTMNSFAHNLKRGGRVAVMLPNLRYHLSMAKKNEETGYQNDPALTSRWTAEQFAHLCYLQGLAVEKLHFYGDMAPGRKSECHRSKMLFILAKSDEAVLDPS